MATKTTRELMIEYRTLIQPINAGVASEMTAVINKIAEFEAEFGKLEQRSIQLVAEGVTDLSTNTEIQDLNASTRALAVELLNLPFVVADWGGRFEFATELFQSATIFFKTTQGPDSYKIGLGAAKQSAGDVLSEFIEGFWEWFALETLPPFERGDEQANIFTSNILGGTIELLGGNDIFMPHDTDEPYNADGGNGNDVMFGGASSEDNIFGGLGNDTIIAANALSSAHGDDGNDWIQVDGKGSGSISNSINGNNGSDTLLGGSKEDRLYGTNSPAEPDEIKNASATDVNVLIGRGGGDLMYGGIGNDFLMGDNLIDSQGTQQNIAFAGVISDLSSKVGSSGQSGNDTLVGYAGNDVMAGGGGNDALYGDEYTGLPLGLPDGNDTLFGDAGNDKLFGGGGNDTLNGGQGNDILEAGMAMTILLPMPTFLS